MIYRHLIKRKTIISEDRDIWDRIFKHKKRFIVEIIKELDEEEQKKEEKRR